MKNKLWLILCVILPLIAARAQTPPSLEISRVAGQQIRVTWSATGAFTLQEATSFAPPVNWRSLDLQPSQQGDQFTLTLQVTSARRYFRLISEAQEPLSTITATSPSIGEIGVSVTRETVVYFSSALSEAAPLDLNHFYATFGDRRLLGRVELSSDRRKAAFFPLETLPGGARVTVTLDATGLRDAAGRELDADANGVPGGIKTFQYDTYALTPVGNTAVIGQVFASDPIPDPQDPRKFSNRPLAGVTVTVDGREQEIRAVTDANGRFKLGPVPAGRFFVHVDGRTATGSQWPAGDYYPVVGKAWEAAAGREDNLAGGTGEIFLPLIKSGTLQPVSATNETAVTFPAVVLAQNPDLAGVTVTVPANSLFSDNGTRGGKVGIAPVPPDRLPERLPPGLNLPLVITVQTDGPSNFDRPVPVRFPNLPDPRTGKILPPGAKSALWSFNHDLGRWEIIGPMTVSADGRFVDSDPGVGIQQPGWHGTQGGSQGGGGDLSGDDNDTDDDGIPDESDDDIDGDGVPNGEDPDVDGDGIPNGEDDDIDGDGIPNGDDSDADGDGVPNDSDDDADGDGVPNDQDGDDDGDGVPDENEEMPCEEGQPCDDGDPCTTDDRCINGQCVGTPVEGGVTCGPNGSASIDKTSWSTTESDADAGGNYTSHQGFTIQGGICQDSSSQSWKFRIGSLKWSGKINITLAFGNGTFSLEPNPVDGGNITEANYCGVITELAGYLGRGRGAWHLKAASRNHENHHRDIDWPGLLNPIWNGIEQAMAAESVPCGTPADEASAILLQRVQDADAMLESEFSQAVGNYNSGHDSARTDEAYQAGQNVLNFMIDQIRTYAQSKGWAACPAPAQVHLLAANQAEPTIQRIDASIQRELLDPGESVPLTVTAFQGNSPSDVTRAAGTTYLSTAPGVANVSPTGIVTAVAPGIATILVQHAAARDRQPFRATVKITVRSPGDRDADRMPDEWERVHGLNPANPADAFQDADGDKLINRREFELGTDPTRIDSDSDGVTDFEETLRGTSPRSRFKPRRAPSRGLHYFVLMNLATGSVEQRGITGADGVAHAALIMAPQTRYRQWVLRARDLYVGTMDWISADNGQRFQLPAVVLRPDTSIDSDGDGLTDLAEFIMGSNLNRADTDGDGVPDGAEVRSGSDPNDGFAVRTGVIDSADTPGLAVDVAALNNLVAVADSAAGVALFDVRGPRPILAAQIDTPGQAQRVAWNGNLIAVADGPDGLAVIDASDPARARLLLQVPAGTVSAVTAAAGLAYAGLQSGHVLAIELLDGTILRRLSLGQPIRDVALGNDHLYVLTETTLFALDVAGGDLTSAASVTSPTLSTPNSRLSIGGNIAYAVHGKGFNTFDLTDPAAPKLIAAGNTSQFGWEHIVPNGSGLGVAAVGSAFAFDRQRVFSLYDVSDPKVSDRFITAYTHGGHARAVSIFNGIAYGAAHDAGLQVINYLSADTRGQPPSISLTADFPLNPARAEESKTVRVTALAVDDVQVRNVEFYLNDALVAVDGNFPFEHRFITPRRTGANSFRLRAVAFDTGGNRTETPTLSVELVPDATAPRVVGQSPDRGQIVGATDTITVFFSEPIDASTLTLATFSVRHAGADGIFGTTDDAALPGGTISYRTAINGGVLKLAAPLAPGFYRAVIRPPVADVTGNLLAREASWDFLVLGGSDSDLDGVPDNVEALLGLDPNRSDTNGNGILDGDEDADVDGLRTAWELAFGLDPRKKDSNDDGRSDGDEDLDRDGLTNAQEQLARTHPQRSDTDADGWPDEGEVTAGSDPLDRSSTPALVVVARQKIDLVLPMAPALTALEPGVTVARPPILLTLPAAPQIDPLDTGTTVARPPIKLLLPVAPQSSLDDSSVTVARPPVRLLLPQAPQFSGQDTGLTVAQPPVRVSLPGNSILQTDESGVTIARPPVTVQLNN